MDRSNHYETAFEAYLRDRRLGYVAVDEAKRSSIDDEPIKSIDFIVHGHGSKLLVDIKGRKFPGGTAEKPRRTWQNWVEQEDIDGLERWATQFGSDYLGLIVFAYQLQPAFELRPGTPDLWVWNGQRYLMRAIAVQDYRKHMRVRSPRWRTVHLPTIHFRELVRPFREFTHPHEIAVPCNADP